MHRLWLFRHAKSDWNSAAGDDFQRPLSKRGRRDAPRMGQWLEEHGVRPDSIWCSPAVRARETLERARRRWTISADRIRYIDALYGAGGRKLLALVQAAEETLESLMLVGHNPGLEDLLETLCEESPPRTAKGKLLTTGNLVEVALRGVWQDLAWDSGELMQIVRPRDLH